MLGQVFESGSSGTTKFADEPPDDGFFVMELVLKFKSICTSRFAVRVPQRPLQNLQQLGSLRLV
jgi:hypothetical protein